MRLRAVLIDMFVGNKGHANIASPVSFEDQRKDHVSQEITLHTFFTPIYSHIQRQKCTINKQKGLSSTLEIIEVI